MSPLPLEDRLNPARAPRESVVPAPWTTRIERLAARLLGVSEACVVLAEEGSRHPDAVMVGLTRQVLNSGEAVVLDTAQDGYGPAYAGVPLHGSEGGVLGALYVVDARPRNWTADEIDRLRDLAVSAAAEEALRESEERFRQLAEHIREVFWIHDPERDRFLYVSPAYEEVWGRSRGPLYQSAESLLDAVYPEDRERVRAALEKRKWEGYDEEFRILHPDGSIRWIRDRAFPIRNAEGQVYRTVGIAEDLSQQKRTEQQLAEDAMHDPLTGLPNRALFMERLGHAILRMKRHPEYLFAVLFLDLDRFKVVNDSLGHHVGDEMLVAVADRLKRCLRPEDTVARLGGDEFAILLDSIGEVTDATRIAERIHEELSSPVNLSGYEVFTSASIGIALSSGSYDRPEYLLRNADMAMYRAKASELSRYEVFDYAMHAEALARLQLETDLRRAVERSEFRLQYQPVIRLDTGRIAGVEVLVRWKHPDRDWVPPRDFIPLAEETGLIFPIGAWVLREACQQLQRWRARFPGLSLAVGVNLSVKQFSEPDLVEQVRRVLEESGLEPRSLKLEITESAIVENSGLAIHMLGQLKALGVQVFMDDFGTGYSSLGYLHRLPLDALKIDRSFVGRMDTEARHAQLVRTILTLARSVGIFTVAEGVETGEQLRELRALGCEYAQGYLFSPPVDAEDLEILLREDRRW